MASAANDPAGLSNQDHFRLLEADAPELDALAALAADVQTHSVGAEVRYVVNRSINITNVCYTGCPFCAFAQRRTDADADAYAVNEGRVPN